MLQCWKLLTCELFRTKKRFELGIPQKIKFQIGFRGFILIWHNSHVHENLFYRNLGFDQNMHEFHHNFFLNNFD